MKRICKLIAVLLVTAILLAGCNAAALRQWVQGLLGQQAVTFAQIEYSRPDMGQFRAQLDACIRGAEEDTNIDALMEKVYALYDDYYRFYTNYKLANIYYYKDLTNTYWSDEYTFCLENVSEVDAGMDKLLHALADSQLKSQLEAEKFFGEGYFEDYTGQSIWDENFIQLMDKEMRLQNEYDALSTQALEFPYYSEAFYNSIGLQMEQLLVELLTVRQEMARHAGYDDYLQFAYEFYYNRDYSPEQAIEYMEDVRDELVQMYIRIPYDAWSPRYEDWSQNETFSYVESGANAMGGVIAEAFALLKDGGFYDISYGANKYNASFETYLQYYHVPFVFMCPQGNGSDPLTFAHEFGHFCNDYISAGTACGADVAEVFSQGMEYLTLFYAQGGDSLKKMALADSLATFVEQSAYANFEHRLYLLDEDELTVENVRKLYEQTAEDYGFAAWGYDKREYATLAHLYIAPVYTLSYVLSNDLAMQIYQAEEAQTGTGKKLLEDNLNTEEVSLLSFAESAGLTNPFTGGRVEQLRKTFEKVLG